MRWALILLALALPAQAQDLPDWQYTSINDFAGVLTQDDTRVLDEALIALHDQTGVEGTVVTLTDRARYGGGDGLEPFATRLFNHWGVGDATRNDGFMLLMLQNDREIRIELGAGYPASAEQVAARIIDDVVLPDFRAGRMSEGIRDGTLAVIERIARPHAAGEVPQTGSRFMDWLVGALFAGAAGLIGFRVLRDRLGGLRRCPQCRGRGLVEQSEIGSDGAPQQMIWTSCPSCGWRGSRLGPNRGERDRRGGGGGFGGGRSSGGGASGRW